MKSALVCLAAASLLIFSGCCSTCAPSGCSGGPSWGAPVSSGCDGSCGGGGGGGLLGALFGAGGGSCDGGCGAGGGFTGGGALAGMSGCGGGVCAGRCGGGCPLASAIAGEIGTLGQTVQGAVSNMPAHMYNSCLNGPCGSNGAPGPTAGAVTYPYYTTRGPRDFLMANPPSIGP